MGDPNFKPIHINPVTGFLDTRSTPDEVPFGGYRWVEDFEVTAKHRLCRMTGWRKLLDATPYNNQDLRDQLESYTRQYVTLLYQGKSQASFSKLYAGTQNRIYAYNSSTGNWKVISDALGGTAESGCSERRFKAGQEGQIIVFTNNYDPPVYHVMDQPAGSDDQSVDEIEDFTTLKITKVGVVIGWEGLMLYMNVEEDGQRCSDRILWSDYKRPLSIVPDAEVSLAGRFDLGGGAAILGAAPLVDRLLIYTTRGIWECTKVGGDQVLAFSRRYSIPATSGPNRCLAYPNTLVSDGTNHWYWATDGIYRYSLYDTEPELVEWLHRATAEIFDNLNKARCQVHCGAYRSDKKAIVWTWAQGSESCPSKSIMVSTEYLFASFIPHGFSALVDCKIDDLKSLREWMLEQCICTAGEMEVYGEHFKNEGDMDCSGENVDVVRPVPVGGALLDPEAGAIYDPETGAAVWDPEVAGIGCDTPPANFFSGTGVADELAGITVEDLDGLPDANSLYTLLADLTVDEVCAAEYQADECSASPLFIGALVQDRCLKEFADVYYRERCTDVTGCGTYSQEGYRGLLRSGAIHLKDPDNDKIVNRFAVEAHPSLAVVPSELRVRIGVASHAVDPNTASGRCVIIWEDLDAQLLECLSDATMLQHLADQTRPNDEMEWGLFHTGRYFYYEVYIKNPDVSPEDTGGACCISRFTFDAALVQRKRS